MLDTIHCILLCACAQLAQAQRTSGPCWRVSGEQTGSGPRCSQRISQQVPVQQHVSSVSSWVCCSWQEAFLSPPGCGLLSLSPVPAGISEGRGGSGGRWLCLGHYSGQRGPKVPSQRGFSFLSSPESIESRLLFHSLSPFLFQGGKKKKWKRSRRLKAW